MQETRPTVNPNSGSKTRRTGGYAFATLGVIIIIINVFIIVTLRGQVPTLSKALLPLGCILVIAGFCFCCLKDAKTQRPQNYDSSNFVTTHQVVPHQNSVTGIDDFPPKYEDCVVVDMNNHHVVTTTSGWDSGGGNFSSDPVSSGGTYDSGGGCTDSGGGCTDSGGGCTDSGGGCSSAD